MRCAHIAVQIRGCPRNCRRIADDHRCHWGWTRSLGRWVRSDNPQARKPAAGHGHARKRRAGCSDVARVAGVSAAWGRGQNATATALTECCFAVEPYSVKFYCRSFFAPLAAHIARSTPWRRVQAILANIRGPAWFPCVSRLGIDGCGYGAGCGASRE